MVDICLFNAYFLFNCTNFTQKLHIFLEIVNIQLKKNKEIEEKKIKQFLHKLKLRFIIILYKNESNKQKLKKT